MSVSRYNGDTPRGLEVFAMKKNAMNPHRLAVLAMMTAVVFAVNFPRIIIPLPTGETSFTLANIACVLSGMLLGPLGGLASGLGSALYDLTNPIFAPECWLTFLTKGAMGLAAGLVFRTPEQRETASYRRCLASSLVGCLTYYLLYFSKGGGHPPPRRPCVWPSGRPCGGPISAWSEPPFGKPAVDKPLDRTYNR